jgi:hypothetical protein
MAKLSSEWKGVSVGYSAANTQFAASLFYLTSNMLLYTHDYATTPVWNEADRYRPYW